jgi:hypothetical protein
LTRSLSSSFYQDVPGSVKKLLVTLYQEKTGLHFREELPRELSLCPKGLELSRPGGSALLQKGDLGEVTAPASTLQVSE